MPGSRQSESMFDQPLPQEPISPPQSRHPLRRQERRSLSDAGLKDFRNVVSEANDTIAKKTQDAPLEGKEKEFANAQVRAGRWRNRLRAFSEKPKSSRGTIHGGVR